MMPALFKVLVDGQSCHGGDATYPPVGEWTEAREPKCCASGWHLTTDPLAWWKPTARLYLAEGEAPLHGDGGDKAAFSRVRLLAEVTWDWPYLCTFPRVRAFLAASARSIDPQADISDANLSSANLSDANLCRAYLAGADLSSANLSDANLSDANLSSANLTDANLSDANLSDANLAGADLAGANLAGADLAGADLYGANLAGADLYGANLSDANLTRAYRPVDPPDGWRVNADGRLERSC